MSDESLRELERAASLGDEGARVRLVSEFKRRPPNGVEALEYRLNNLLGRALSGVKDRHAGVPKLQDVAGVVLKGLKAPSITSGLIWRDGWTWKRNQARVLIVAVKAGGAHFGEIAIGVGCTINLDPKNAKAVGSIWPLLQNAFPLESDEYEVRAGRLRPDIKAHREGLAVVWASQVRVGHGHKALRAPVLVAEWWARNILNRWTPEPLDLASSPTASPSSSSPMPQEGLSGLQG